MEDTRKKAESTLSFLRLRSSCCGCANVEDGSKYIAVVNIVLLVIVLIVTAINTQWASLVFVLLQLGLNIFLYYAAVKRVANWLLVYLGGQFILLLVLLITGCVESGGSALVICLVIAMFILMFYFWVIVYSFYMQLRDEEAADKPRSTATSQET